MIALAWLGKGRKLAVAPVVVATIHNHTPYRGAMAAYPLCGTFYHNIGPML